MKNTILFATLFSIAGCNVIEATKGKGSSTRTENSETNKNQENKNQENTQNQNVEVKKFTSGNIHGQIFSQVVHRESSTTLPYGGGTVAFIGIVLNGGESDCSSDLIKAQSAPDADGKYAVQLDAGQYFAIRVGSPTTPKDFIEQYCKGRGKVKSFGPTGVESIIGSAILHVDPKSSMVADSSSDLVIKIDDTAKTAELNLLRIQLTP